MVNISRLGFQSHVLCIPDASKGELRAVALVALQLDLGENLEGFILCAETALASLGIIAWNMISNCQQTVDRRSEAAQGTQQGPGATRR